MAHEAFDPYKPSGKSGALIQHAQDIIEEYQQQGLVMTLRQLYYQFVSRDLIPNSDKSYSNLGSVISRARLGGYLDWDAIEDRNRVPVIWKQYNNVEEVIEQAVETFRLPRLDGQHTYAELWVEKDALSGVLRPTAAKYHVTLMANKGYSSSSAMKDAGDRIRSCCERYGCENAAIFYLGDLDPSGEDMVRDIRDRIGMFLNQGLLVGWNGGSAEVENSEDNAERKPHIEVEVKKLALTMAQVKRYKPPPNPAKLTDSRAKEFIKRYGSSSWEVDALPPTVLRQLIVDELESVLDLDLMEEIEIKEKAQVDRLRKALETL
jgi:hypothetical protein